MQRKSTLRLTAQNGKELENNKNDKRTQVACAVMQMAKKGKGIQEKE